MFQESEQTIRPHFVIFMFQKIWLFEQQNLSEGLKSVFSLKKKRNSSKRHHCIRETVKTYLRKRDLLDFNFPTSLDQSSNIHLSGKIWALNLKNNFILLKLFKIDLEQMNKTKQWH